MPAIVGVHGVLYDYLGEATTPSVWGAILRHGLRRAGRADLVNQALIEVVYYGNLFRPHGGKGQMPDLTVDDLDDTEQALLLAFADALASPEVTKDHVPGTLQSALRLLLRQPFFGVLVGAYGERALLFGLRQVGLYINDDGIRTKVHESFAKVIAADTRVVIAHSLGSIIAYECLCTGRYPQIRALVTVGSPLGIVFDWLRPAPIGGKGQFPPRRALDQRCG